MPHDPFVKARSRRQTNATRLGGLSRLPIGTGSGDYSLFFISPACIISSAGMPKVVPSTPIVDSTR